ncbi:penicillin-binding protein activator [Pseudolabrys sp. Root1462]|uniref:penicillin-binding protein activator n=1 Tax=Pseudolabrys sp. Root1462 TaxID=1736466 RepID=UPI0012E33A06|nr:penicillin-binding protein activator [Pseudolabrys sp. Root1462]
MRSDRQGITRRRLVIVGGFAAASLALAGCTGGALDRLDSPQPQPQQPAGEPAQPSQIGSGQIRVGLILPLSAQGNAGVAALSMKNAAEMALAEFKEPNIQLLVKDDGGSPQGAQAAAQQALAEGAEIIIGPLFAQSVSAVGAVARGRNIPVIAFSTDASVATRGVYLLSFLPESDVRRIVDFAVSRGKRSFAALLPDNAYGTVIEAAFQQEVARRGGRVVALEKYPLDPARMGEAVRRVAQAASRADALFIPDGADAVPQVVAQLETNRVNLKRLQLLGTGLWDDPRIFSNASLAGGWYAAPDAAGFRSFAQRYRGRYGQEPVRTATLSYDAVALVAALVKTQGTQRFNEQILTTSSGFAGIDGVFRFMPDGTNERGLAVLRVAPGGGQVVSPAPKAF